MSTLEFCRRIRYLHRFCGQHLMYLSVYLWSRDDGPLLMDTQYVFGASRYCRYAQNLYWSLGYFVVCHNYNWLPRTYPYCLYNSFSGRTSHSFRVWIIFHLFPCCVEDAPTASQTAGAGTWHWHQIWAVPQFWLRILCNTIHANLAIWNIVDPWTRQVN